jgi:hypothetical protein
VNHTYKQKGGEKRRRKYPPAFLLSPLSSGLPLYPKGAQFFHFQVSQNCTVKKPKFFFVEGLSKCTIFCNVCTPLLIISRVSDCLTFRSDVNMNKPGGLIYFPFWFIYSRVHSVVERLTSSVGVRGCTKLCGTGTRIEI